MGFISGEEYCGGGEDGENGEAGKTEVEPVVIDGIVISVAMVVGSVTIPVARSVFISVVCSE